MRPRILFLDHVGVLGGGQLSLLDIARNYAASSRVVLFSDGIYRQKLDETGIQIDLFSMSANLRNVKRESGFLSSLISIHI